MAGALTIDEFALLGCRDDAGRIPRLHTVAGVAHESIDGEIFLGRKTSVAIEIKKEGTLELARIDKHSFLHETRRDVRRPRQSRQIEYTGLRVIGRVQTALAPTEFHVGRTFAVGRFHRGVPREVGELFAMQRHCHAARIAAVARSDDAHVVRQNPDVAYNIADALSLLIRNPAGGKPDNIGQGANAIRPAKIIYAATAFRAFAAAGECEVNLDEAMTDIFRASARAAGFYSAADVDHHRCAGGEARLAWDQDACRNTFTSGGYTGDADKNIFNIGASFVGVFSNLGSGLGVTWVSA